MFKQLLSVSVIPLSVRFVTVTASQSRSARQCRTADVSTGCNRQPENGEIRVSGDHDPNSDRDADWLKRFR